MNLVGAGVRTLVKLGLTNQLESLARSTPLNLSALRWFARGLFPPIYLSRWLSFPAFRLSVVRFLSFSFFVVDSFDSPVYSPVLPVRFLTPSVDFFFALSFLSFS